MLAFYQASLTIPELVPDWNHLWPRGGRWHNPSCWLLRLREGEGLSRHSLPCIQPLQPGGAPTMQSSKCRGTDIKLQAQASPVVQQLRLCLPMRETRVQFRVSEDPTSHRATEATCHSYWRLNTLELMLCNRRSLRTTAREESLLTSRRHSPGAATGTGGSQKINTQKFKKVLCSRLPMSFFFFKHIFKLFNLHKSPRKMSSLTKCFLKISKGVKQSGDQLKRYGI